MAAIGLKRQVLGLVVLIAVCFAAAGIGGAVTSPQIENWYATLAKPSWNPPNWVFGPVWSALYLCMAVAAWLVWRQKGWLAARGPLALFGVQLALNTLWSCLFFGLHSPGLAFAGGDPALGGDCRHYGQPSGDDRSRRASCSCPIWLGSALPAC